MNGRYPLYFIIFIHFNMHLINVHDKKIIIITFEFLFYNFHETVNSLFLIGTHKINNTTKRFLCNILTRSNKLFALFFKKKNNIIVSAMTTTVVFLNYYVCTKITTFIEGNKIKHSFLFQIGRII